MASLWESISHVKWQIEVQLILSPQRDKRKRSIVDCTYGHIIYLNNYHSTIIAFAHIKLEKVIEMQSS